jgi:Fe2+ transport system protein FeoA
VNIELRSSISTVAGASDRCLVSLNEVVPGALVRVKRLLAEPTIGQRLREMGIREDQVLRLLHRNGNLVCQVNQTRMGLSGKIAERIWVEPLDQTVQLG